MYDDFDRDLYGGIEVPIREVAGGRLGSSAHAAPVREATADRLTHLEQCVRWVEDTRAQCAARVAAVDRQEQVRRDAATVRERLALGQRLEAAVDATFEARPAAMTAGRARALQWQAEQAEQAGHAARGQADGRRLGDAWERRHGGPRP